ncbi:MAG: hypothetical protein WCK00_15185, partial [Deltaproteobacteria bacterium]
MLGSWYGVAMPKGGFRTTVILNWFLLAACIHPSIGKSDSPALGDPDFPLISLDPTVVLHKASSYVIGINRNHVPVTFRNGLAKLEKMKELTPVWGQRRILYRNGHGPTDGRLDYNHMTGYHFEATFGSNSSYPFDAKAPYPYDDLRNALWEAQVMGADQLHVINFGTGDPEEAGRYVGYLNGSADPLRTDHPIPRQDVGLFELGNEITWDKVRGHDPYALTVAAYATRGKAFAQKMRPRSGVPIKIGMSLSVNTSFTASHWATPPAQALQTMLDIMGDDLDFITFHGYSGWPMQVPYPGSQAPAADRLKFLESIFSQLAYGGRIIETQLVPVIRQHNGDHGRDVFLLNSEFFSNLYQDAALSRGQFGALFSAATAVQAFRNDIRGAVNFCFSHGDIGDSLMFLGEDPTRVTAVFQFLRLLAGHWG